MIPILQILFDGKPKLPFIGKDDFIKALCFDCRMKFSIREFIIGVKGGNFFISMPMD